jgi:hypothetical protein
MRLRYKDEASFAAPFLTLRWIEDVEETRIAVDRADRGRGHDDHEGEGHSRRFDHEAAARQRSSCTKRRCFMPQPSRATRLMARSMRWVGAAAADMAAHLRDDLSTSRVRVPLQQIGRAHDLAGLTVAALRHPLGKPSLLHGMR